MKYSSLNVPKEKVYSIAAPKKGINISAPPRSIADEQAVFAKNVIPTNGILKTRNGLCANMNGILKFTQYTGWCEYRYKLTDTEIYFGGEYRKIAVERVDYSNSKVYYCIYLLGTDAEVVPMGYIEFGRVTSDSFFKPESITFYAGKPQRGGGIFAFVTLRDTESTGNVEYRIYEVNDTFTGWEICYGYYTPTVYINGRGNKYENAAVLNQVYTAKPTTLEALNLLDGSFFAYYTSDGYSNSFRLPFSDIDSASVICRIYHNLNSYTEWVIIEGNNKSGKKSFFDAEVEMNVDREKGTVYFTVDSADYAVPIMNMYSENNIRIFARKNFSKEFSKVVSSKLSLMAGGKIYVASGIAGNEVFVADYDNPLYFPQLNNNIVGDLAAPITAFGVKDQKVLVFKENEIYSLKLKNGDALNRTSLLADNGRIFKEAYSFDVTLFTNMAGCKKDRAVYSMGNEVFWQGSDANVYTVSGHDAVVLTEQVSGLLKEYFSGENVFSAVMGKNFILCGGRNAAIINCNKQESVCYFWEFPEKVELLGAVADKEDVAFLCKSQGEEFAYTASLNGKCDTEIISVDGGYSLIETPIESVIKTKSFAIGKSGTKKRINSAVLRLSSYGQIKIALGDGNTNAEFNSLSLQTGTKEGQIKLITDAYPLNEFSIELISNNGISFEGADIYYTESTY